MSKGTRYPVTIVPVGLPGEGRGGEGELKGGCVELR